MIFKLNEEFNLLYLHQASEVELLTLNSSFNKTIEGWHFKKKHYKGSSWNGVVEFFKDNRWISFGLWKEVKRIANKYNLVCEIEGLEDTFNKDIDFKTFKKRSEDFFVGHSDIKEIRDYQIKTAFDILMYKKCLAELATSAGKTLMSFLTIIYMLETNPKAKILIIVPNVTLVDQTIEDFLFYNNGKLDLKCQAIYGGSTVKPDVNIVVGTYQSLVKKDKKYFEDFTTCIIDEVHRAKAVSVKKILQKCLHCEYRYGMSGTIQKETSIDGRSIMSYTGPIISEINAKYLMNRGFVTEAHVRIICLKYNIPDISNGLRKIQANGEGAKALHFEKEYVQNSENRTDYIINLVSKVKKNTLVLFHHTDYGKMLFKRIKDLRNDMVVYFVSGDTPKNLRNMYKKEAEKNDNVIIVASYGTFATGINIKNLHYLFLTESFKSDQLIRQSIGRVLRLNKGKKSVYIIDISDDLSLYEDGKCEWKSYLKKHSQERIRIYKEQQFEYKFKEVIIE